MEIDDEYSVTKKCYKCEEPVLDNLNLFYNSSNSKLVLWNKYQIFVYKDTELECLEKIFIPEFQIHLLFASNNYIVCLDCNGNVHITSLKFKSSNQKTLKIPFQSRDEGIKVCVRHKEDHVLSLKYEADTYFLCLHKINADFQLEKKVILLCNNEHWPLGQQSKEKYLLTSHLLKKDNFDQLNKIIKSEETFHGVHELVVLSVDKLNVYACLFSPKMSSDELTLVTLYSCPAEICKIEIVHLDNLHLLIGLTMGTVIRLTLSDVSKTPVIVHLNTALYKMLTLKDSLIYSDGTTMWKAEDTFSDMKLTQIFVKNTNDFLKCGDQIICTTFTKMIYKFSIDSQTAFLIPKKDEYCSAEKLLNNSAYLDKLFEEIDKDNDLVKKFEKQQHYITALALSKRQDVVNKAIATNITVFQTYEEANIKECTLTEDIKEYFAIDTWIFSVTITNSTLFETLNSILSHLSDRISIYVTLSTTFKVLKTTCIKMDRPLKMVNYLIPLILTNEAEINVNTNIVINIPAALDEKKLLTVLYKNDTTITSEHFIKMAPKTINSLKKPAETDVIQQVSEIQYGSIFNFTNISKLEPDREYTFYIKLAKDFEQTITEYSKTNLSPKALLIQQMNAPEFLKSKKNIIFSIANDKVKVEVHNDGFSNPQLKVTSGNAQIALNVRNFFANVIYNDYEDHEPGKEFIGYSFYTSTENFQKAVKSCIRSSAPADQLLPLMDQFEKNIVGGLPL